MATYPIFTQDGGQRIAVNPDSVTSVIEVERGRVVINLPDGGTATISMPLEDVVGRSRTLDPDGQVEQRTGLMRFDVGCENPGRRLGR